MKLFFLATKNSINLILFKRAHIDRGTSLAKSKKVSIDIELSDSICESIIERSKIILYYSRGEEIKGLWSWI